MEQILNLEKKYFVFKYLDDEYLFTPDGLSNHFVYRKMSLICFKGYSEHEIYALQAGNKLVFLFSGGSEFFKLLRFKNVKEINYDMKVYKVKTKTVNTLEAIIKTNHKLEISVCAYFNWSQAVLKKGPNTTFIYDGEGSFPELQNLKDTKVEFVTQAENINDSAISDFKKRKKEKEEERMFGDIINFIIFLLIGLIFYFFSD